MISAQTDQVAQEHLIEKYMALPNQVWDTIINQATQVRHVETVQGGELQFLLIVMGDGLLQKLIKRRWWLTFT